MKTYFLLSFNWYNKWNIGKNTSIKLAKQIRIIPIIDWRPRLLTRINKDIMLTIIEQKKFKSSFFNLSNSKDQH